MIQTIGIVGLILVAVLVIEQRISTAIQNGKLDPIFARKMTRSRAFKKFRKRAENSLSIEPLMLAEMIERVEKKSVRLKDKHLDKKVQATLMGIVTGANLSPTAQGYANNFVINDKQIYNPELYQLDDLLKEHLSLESGNIEDTKMVLEIEIMKTLIEIEKDGNQLLESMLLQSM